MRQVVPNGQRSAGFTLVEVGLSLLILSIAVVSTMLLFPIGIRAQNASRFQIYACAKALEMVDAYVSFKNTDEVADYEAPEPWQTPMSIARGHLPDLEQKLCDSRFGNMPVPLDIAKRLDSDGDEIAQILQSGGYIYYSQPTATTGLAPVPIPDNPPNEARRLVFAVVGLPQQNAISYFPWKRWPYYITYPSPPAQIDHRPEVGFSIPAGTPVTTDGLGNGGGYLWEDLSTKDPDIRQVYESTKTDSPPPPAVPAKYGYKNHANTRTPESAKRYCQAALWYCKKKGMPAALYNGSAVLTAPIAGVDLGTQVRALRFVAHAASTLTTYFTEPVLSAGLLIDAADVEGSGTFSDPLTVTPTVIQNLYDSCVNVGMAAAAAFPYDWSILRPANRAIMMDHPLLQWDLFSPTRSGTLWKTLKMYTNTNLVIPAQQWKPIAAQPIANIGRGAQFMDRDIPPAGQPSIWGDPTHFTLADPFSAAERCRQLVFWSVDWQSYEDFETAPSAPIDASKYPSGAPVLNTLFRDLISYSSTQSVKGLQFRDYCQVGVRNPEKVIVFAQDMSAMPTGTDVSATVDDGSGMGYRLSTMVGGIDGTWGDGVKDQVASVQIGPTATAAQKISGMNRRRIFCGLFGADRNSNGKLDRGPLPASQRLRATTVLRFNYYDLRVPSTVR